MTDTYAVRQLEDILRAAHASTSDAARYTLLAYPADAALPEVIGDAWVVQGSLLVMHANALLDNLPAGAHVPLHARAYNLRASASGCVLAHEKGPTSQPSSPSSARREVGVLAPPPAAPPPPRSTGNWTALRTNLSDRLGKRWPFLVLAAVTLQALDLVVPLTAGFAVDEVLISEHRHAWTLCLACGVTTAFLRAMLQSSAHRTLFWRTPQDLIPRGVAYAAWLQGVGAWLAVGFEAVICPPLAAVMSLGLAIQVGILLGALPRQKRWAEASATDRWHRARRLRLGLRHAEALVTQGYVPTLAAEAATSQPDADIAAARSPRASMVVAWLGHIAVMIVAARLCQDNRLSLGMVGASLLLNLQMHAQLRGLLANAGDFLRPTRFDIPRDARRDDSLPLRQSITVAEPLAVSGADATQRTHLARTLCAEAPSGEAQYIGTRSALPAGTLRHAVARHAKPGTPDVLRALAWSGSQHNQGLDAQVVTDDPRLSDLARAKLHIAHALCAAPRLVVLDGVLDACGRSEAGALLTNLTRGLPQSEIVLFTRRDDLAQLCRHQITLTKATERA